MSNRDEIAAELDGSGVRKPIPQIVCCVCGEPCSVYSPVCAKCATTANTTIGAKS